MLPGAQLLTAPTSCGNFKSDDLSYSARSLISSSFIFLHVDHDTTSKQDERMDQMQSRQRSRTTNHENELWFSMPSDTRREGDHSAYQATSVRHNASRSTSSSQYHPIPSISTSTVVDKPLPASPGSEKKKRKPASLRDLIRRRPSNEHLQPEPNPGHQRATSALGKLSPEAYLHDTRQSSRSMPSSPLSHVHTPSPATLSRAHSSGASYAEATSFQAYSLQPPPHQQQRSVSMETFFDPSTPRTRRTFPESNTLGAAPRDSGSDRARPHTWLSPTEPFQDASDVHLFAEAMCGLPDDFDSMSPDGGPSLHGSLFSRGRQSDRIPVVIQDRSITEPPPPPRVDDWQSMGYDWVPQQQPSRQTDQWSSQQQTWRDTPEWVPQQSPMRQQDTAVVSASAFPRRDSYDPAPSPGLQNLNAVNLELERLGIEDVQQPDDELPNYAQSQAEMSEKKRKEASARARELEARWNSSRGWRSR